MGTMKVLLFECRPEEKCTNKNEHGCNKRRAGRAEDEDEDEEQEDEDEEQEDEVEQERRVNMSHHSTTTIIVLRISQQNV
jgi:hypothetical protein